MKLRFHITAAAVAVIAIAMAPVAPAQAGHIEQPVIPVPDYPALDDLFTYSWPSPGEVTGFNADGTAVAANRLTRSGPAPGDANLIIAGGTTFPVNGLEFYGNTEARIHVLAFDDAQGGYVKVQGGGRTLDTRDFAYGAALLSGNPTRGHLIGNTRRGGTGRTLICADEKPFLWTENLANGGFFINDQPNSTFYGQSAYDQFFGKVGGYAYVGNGADPTAYPTFMGEYRGTEFGTGLFAGIEINDPAGPHLYADGVLVDIYGHSQKYVPDAIYANDVAAFDDWAFFYDTAAIIVGMRDDGHPGAWEVDREGNIGNLAFSGTRILQPDTSLLQHARGASPRMGWDYHVTAVSNDGMMLVGYAEAPVGSIVRLNGTEQTIQGPIAVYWKVEEVVDGRLWLSEAFPLGVPTRFSWAILGMETGLIKANDVFYDRLNEVYVVSGTDQNGMMAIATVHSIDL